MGYYDGDADTYRRSLRNIDKAVFDTAPTVSAKENLVLEDSIYCTLFVKPTKASLAKIGWRYRECFRKAEGQVPEHVVDNILRTDLRYVGILVDPKYKYKLTEAQQTYVAKQSPWQVHLWREAFTTKTLNRVEPDYLKKLDLFVGVGFVEKEFDAQFKTSQATSKDITPEHAMHESFTPNF